MTVSQWEGHMRKVPELSLKSFTHGTDSDKESFTQSLFDGLKEYGFIILTDHPISKEILDKAYSLSQTFFELPAETKREYISEDGGFQRGYTPFGTEHAKDHSVADLKEFYHVGRNLEKGHKYEGSYPTNIWPDSVTDFESTFTKIYSDLEETGKIMLRALAPALDVEPSFFDDMVQDGNSILRLLHYPPIPEGADQNAIRAAAHEDINLITILVNATQSGLQLKDRDGTWLDVEAPNNSLIVDAGDMLARATNDVIPATTHRVVNPTGPNVSRYSMPFFMHPNPEAVLSCIPSCKGDGAKYTDITAQDFLMQRLKEIGLM
jgi:isopenicillin N synthase-like dioxygenase